MYVVGFNGPPECGKDTLAEMLQDHMDQQGVSIPVVQASLSSPLRGIAYEMAGWEGKRLDGPDYEEFKRTMFPQFGVTGRQLMIDASEDFLKPKYGQAVMAKLLLGKLQNPLTAQHKVVLIRDSGFQCEVGPIIDAVGADNMLIVNVIRPGKTFEGDSREWVQHINRYVAPNTGTLLELRAQAAFIYGLMVNNLGWKL